MKNVLSSSTGCEKQSNSTEADRQKFSKIYDKVANLSRQVSNLHRSLKRSNQKIKELKSENEKLKQAVNMNILEIDNLEQYSRRENIRIHRVPEPQSKNDDGEEVVVELAEKLGINIESYVIQRAHRFRQKTITNGKTSSYNCQICQIQALKHVVFKINAEELQQWKI